jgi:hypothetical protein
VSKFLILGGAFCVFEDIEASQELFLPDVIIAVNDIGIYIEDIDHWVTMHPEKMPVWVEQRKKHGFEKPNMWTTPEKIEKAKKEVEGYSLVNSKGGSGILGVNLAKFLGATKIVLAGIPMTQNSHFNKENHWMEATLYRQFWRGEKSYVRWVRSMSGWTKEMYGPPTEEWLKET